MSVTEGQWYMAIDGQKVGPVAENEMVAKVKTRSLDASILVFKEGMTAWTAVRDVPKLAQHLSSGRSTSVALPIPARSAVELDPQILGSEMQFVHAVSAG